MSNQVVDVLSETFGPSSKIPALGLPWAHGINTRVFVVRARGQEYQTGCEALSEAHAGLREMRLVWSPMAEAGSCLFRITGEGLESCDAPV